MATTYGAPTGLDLSGCSVTATGGSTSITLADLNKSVNDAATSISTANSVAASAADKADAAYTAINNLDETLFHQPLLVQKTVLPVLILRVILSVIVEAMDIQVPLV